MERQFTAHELLNIALGYIWNPDMSYEDFVVANENLSYQTSHDLYKIINQRYIELKFE